MSTYTREEMVNMKIVRRRADIVALGMIIERVNDYESLNGVDRHVHESLMDTVQSLYIQREEAERKLEDLLEEQGDFAQARAEDCNEN